MRRVGIVGIQNHFHRAWSSENWERNVRLRHSCDTRAKTTWRKAQVKRWRAKQQTKSRLKLFQWKENEKEGKLKIWTLLRHQGDLVSRRQKPRNWWYSVSACKKFYCSWHARSTATTNALVWIDFSFNSAFLHVYWAVNSLATQEISTSSVSLHLM